MICNAHTLLKTCSSCSASNDALSGVLLFDTHPLFSQPPDQSQGTGSPRHITHKSARARTDDGHILAFQISYQQAPWCGIGSGGVVVHTSQTFIDIYTTIYRSYLLTFMTTYASHHIVRRGGVGSNLSRTTNSFCLSCAISLCSRGSFGFHFGNFVLETTTGHSIHRRLTLL